MATIDSRAETAPPKPWGIITTVLWILLTVLISLITSGVALALWTGGVLDRPQDPQDVMSNGPLLSLVSLVSTVVQVPVLAWVARRRGWQAADYLGWVVPKPRDVAVTLALIVALILASDALSYFLDRDLVTLFQI